MKAYFFSSHEREKIYSNVNFLIKIFLKSIWKQKFLQFIKEKKPFECKFCNLKFNENIDQVLVIPGRGR